MNNSYPSEPYNDLASVINDALLFIEGVSAVIAFFIVPIAAIIARNSYRRTAFAEAIKSQMDYESSHGSLHREPSVEIVVEESSPEPIEPLSSD